MRPSLFFAIITPSFSSSSSNNNNNNNNDNDNICSVILPNSLDKAWKKDMKDVTAALDAIEGLDLRYEALMKRFQLVVRVENKFHVYVVLVLHRIFFLSSLSLLF